MFRHDEIIHFQPRPFWKVQPVVDLGGNRMTFSWKKGREFSKPIADKALANVEAHRIGKYNSPS
jgi:hypothetical protein